MLVQDDDKPTLKKVTREEAISNLWTWQDQGHNPFHVIRIFKGSEGGLIVGFTDYIDAFAVQIPEHMSHEYKNYQGAMTAVGAMFDALELEIES